MNDFTRVSSQHELERELGPELVRYRRRGDADIYRGLGFTAPAHTFGPLAAAIGAFGLSIPLAVVAWLSGSTMPIPNDPVWDPILLGWYVLCFACCLGYRYLLPRRAFLAIHKDGFVYQGRFRRRTVLFRQVVGCEANPSSGKLILGLADGSRANWKWFLEAFPRDGVDQLLASINMHKPGSVRVSEVDLGFKSYLRWAGIGMGLLLVGMVVAVPDSSEKARDRMREAFGAAFCGVPTEISVPIFFGLLFSPLVPVGPHLMVFFSRGSGIRRARNLFTEAEHRRALVVSIAGGIYFAILLIAWIMYTSARGI